MSKIGRITNRLAVYIVLLLICTRVAVGRVLTFVSAAPNDSPLAHLSKSTFRHGLVLRAVQSGRHDNLQRHYALEITGTFPYVRVLSLSNLSTPVPVEVASFSPVPGTSDAAALLRGVAAPKGLWATSASLTTNSFLSESSASCASCSSCSCSCGSCSSCGSCFSCYSCWSCGSCGSCGGCGSCGSCSSCDPWLELELN